MTRIGFASVVLCLLGAGGVFAQSAPMIARPGANANRASLKTVSLITFDQPPPLRLHDLINIQVDERTLQQNNARVNRRRQADYQMGFNDLIVLLDGFRLRGDVGVRAQRPAIDVQALNNLRDTMQANRVDRLTASIQAEIVEIKPNGNLVLSAHGNVSVNNENTTYRLSGVVNPNDINMKTRTVSSAKVANKQVDILQKGPTRDATRRGFLTRIVDMFAIF